MTTLHDDLDRLGATALEIKQQRDELLTGCKWFMKQLEDGTLVRDITQDAEPSWALRMMHFVTDLNRITLSIARAEGPLTLPQHPVELRVPAMPEKI